MGAVVLSACASTQYFASVGPVDESTAGGEANDRPRPQSRSALQSAVIAPATDRSATQLGFISRGTGEFVGRSDDVVAAKTFKGTDGVTINLLNAPIAQAAKTVLGDILKADYVISDKVNGTVTVQTSAPVEPAAVADIFEAVLKSNGIALVRAEGHYRLMPLAAATDAPVSLDGHPHGPGITTRIVPLKYVGAAEMRRVIEPMFSKGAILRVDDQRNLLVVNGTGRDLANLENLVSVFDVDWMRQMSFAVIPVKTAEPEVVAKELETVFGIDKDGPLKGVVRVVPNARLNSVLVMSSKPSHLDTARTWIERFERLAQEKEEQIYAYKVQNRPAAELAEILHKVLATDAQQQPGAANPPSVAPRYEPGTVASPAPSNRMGTGLGGGTAVAGLGTGTLAAGGASRTGPFSAAQTAQRPASDAGSAGASYRAGAAKVVVDEQMHTLVIQTVPSEYQRILHVLRRLDVPTTEIMLEGTIAEVTLTDELKFGLKWFFEKGNHRLTFTDAASGVVASSFPGFSYFLATANASVVLDAVSSITKVNVISAPTLTVMNNKTAILQVGDQVPIVTQSAQSVVAAGAPILNTVQMLDTGVMLAVTPHINDNGRVILDIDQEVSNVTPTTSSGIDSPTIQRRHVRTTVTVADGESVALGGLIQERDNNGRTQIPILGDIPVFGTAFRTKQDQINRSELLIIIRPHIARDSEDAQRATEEYRSRIHLDPPHSQMGRSKIDRNLGRILQ